MTISYPGFDPNNPFNNLASLLKNGRPMTSKEAHYISSHTGLPIPKIYDLHGRRNITEENIREVLSELPTGKFTTYKDIANALKNPGYQRIGQTLREAKDMHSIGSRVLPSGGYLKRKQLFRVKRDESFDLKEEGSLHESVGQGFDERIKILEREGLLDLSDPNSHTRDALGTITEIFLKESDYHQLQQ